MADFSRKELVQEVAALLDISERKAKPIVRAVVKAMTMALQTGEDLDIRGLGVFSHKHVVGRYVGLNVPNMLAGKGWIPPHSTVIFTPDRSLSDALNEDPDA